MMLQPPAYYQIIVCREKGNPDRIFMPVSGNEDVMRRFKKEADRIFYRQAEKGNGRDPEILVQVSDSVLSDDQVDMFVKDSLAAADKRIVIRTAGYFEYVDPSRVQSPNWILERMRDRPTYKKFVSNRGSDRDDEKNRKKRWSDREDDEDKRKRKRSRSRD